jgi:hypothetical protein
LNIGHKRVFQAGKQILDNQIISLRPPAPQLKKLPDLFKTFAALLEGRSHQPLCYDYVLHKAVKEPTREYSHFSGIVQLDRSRPYGVEMLNFLTFILDPKNISSTGIRLKKMKTSLQARRKLQIETTDYVHLAHDLTSGPLDPKKIARTLFVNYKNRYSDDIVARNLASWYLTDKFLKEITTLGRELGINAKPIHFEVIIESLINWCVYSPESTEIIPKTGFLRTGKFARLESLNCLQIISKFNNNIIY